MTNISVFGEDKDKQSKKPIEFVHWIDIDEGLSEAISEPNEYENICLLGRNSTNRYDFIMAWNNTEGKDLFLGNWNDGIVE